MILNEKSVIPLRERARRELMEKSNFHRYTIAPVGKEVVGDSYNVCELSIGDYSCRLYPTATGTEDTGELKKTLINELIFKVEKPESKPDKQSGIPGFEVKSTFTGLILCTLMIRYSRQWV